MTQYEKLLISQRNKGIHIKEVGSKTLADYSGMNDEAARLLGFPRTRCPKNTILIDKNSSNIRKLHDLRHEIKERNIIKRQRAKQGKGDYWDAHLESLRAEVKKRKRRK